MISPAYLSDSYARNVQIIKMQTTGISHAESLEQLPFRSNCLNWVVGHIVSNRHNVLKLLSGEHPPDADRVARYRRESEPVTADGPGVLPLEQLIELLEQAQGQISLLLANITPEALSRQVAFFGNRSMAIGEWLLFFYFHDSYHTGQTELLRQAAGKNDKII